MQDLGPGGGAASPDRSEGSSAAAFRRSSDWIVGAAGMPTGQEAAISEGAVSGGVLVSEGTAAIPRERLAAPDDGICVLAGMTASIWVRKLRLQPCQVRRG